VASGRAGPAVPIPDPSSVALVTLNPAGTTAYVVETPSTGPGRIVPIDLSTGTAGTPIDVAAAGSQFTPTSAAFSPDGRTAYLVDAVGGDLLPVDLSAGTAGPSIPVANLAACGDAVTSVVVTPDGQDAYIEGLGSLYDVDLVHHTASAAFHVTPPAGSYGDPSISLSPDGRTLYVLQSGESADDLVPVATNGDNAGQAMSIPVGPKPTTFADPNATASWDKVFVPTDSSALVISFGATPEQIVPVDLATGTAREGIDLSPTKGSSDCGDQAPVAVAITADGTTAVVGEPGTTSVHTLSLTDANRGPATEVGPNGILAVLAAPGWPSSWWAG